MEGMFVYLLIFAYVWASVFVAGFCMGRSESLLVNADCKFWTVATLCVIFSPISAPFIIGYNLAE